MRSKWRSRVAVVVTAIMMFASVEWAIAKTYADDNSTNVLVNGGFEISEEDGRLPGWQPDEDATALIISESVFEEGQRSLQVERLMPTAGSGAVSDAYAAQPFGNVIMTAKVLSEEGKGGKADLRFYDADGKLVSVVSGLVGEPLGKWQSLRVAAAAPKNAVEVRAAFYFNSDQTGRYFVDNVALETQNSSPHLTNLGPQSSSLTLMTAAFGKDRDGRDALFTVAQGDPAQFIVMDVETKEVKATHPLVALDGSSVSAAWAIVTASDGKVYIGSTPNGTLFQYDPMEDKLRAIGKPVPTDTVIWTLVAGEDGKVYGGTGYSQTLFEYDPVTDQTRILKSFKSSSKEAHIRSLAYDSDRQVIYVGGADVAKLYQYDLASGTSITLNPPEFNGMTSVYDLQYAGGKLFVRVDPGPVMFVYDPDSASWIINKNTAYNTRGFSPLSPDGKQVFYTYYETLPGGAQQWSLYSYDVSTGVYGSLGVDVKGAGVAFGYVQLDQSKHPGWTLVGLAGNSGRAFYYNLETGLIETPELPFPPQFVELFNIGKSTDGQMLSSGFISGGGMGIYSPTRNETKHYPQIGQVEGFGSLNGKMYFGVYPKATIFEYDPAKPWNRTDPSEPNNPLRLDQLGYDQDRPVAMLGVPEQNLLYIGSYPIAGKTGGALTIYNPVTRKFDVKRDIIAGHSINSLLYKNGKLFMGTGAMTGGEAKLAIYDTASGRVELEQVPVPGKKAVTSLIWGPDGNIWGMALGALFIYDPDRQEVIYSDDLFPTADYAHSNPHLTVGSDGNVYGTIFTGYVADQTYTSKMFKIDAASKTLSILLESNAEKLAQDDFGNLYFKYGSELMKYSDPNLVVQIDKIQLKAAESLQLHPGDKVDYSYEVFLEKGRTTKELSGASIEYISSRPDKAEIDPSGEIIAKHPGQAELSIRITLNGVTVESNKLKVKITGPY
ncbi:hypothetical protein [Paenibacillus solani]|uniref:hypothetical protein n=1 Tax=Paenibacillus solani TaxID=1705565 RepID=UPI003D2C8889